MWCSAPGHAEFPEPCFPPSHTPLRIPLYEMRWFGLVLFSEHLDVEWIVALRRRTAPHLAAHCCALRERTRSCLFSYFPDDDAVRGS